MLIFADRFYGLKMNQECLYILSGHVHERLWYGDTVNQVVYYAVMSMAPRQVGDDGIPSRGEGTTDWLGELGHGC